MSFALNFLAQMEMNISNPVRFRLEMRALFYFIGIRRFISVKPKLRKNMVFQKFFDSLRLKFVRLYNIITSSHPFRRILHKIKEEPVTQLADIKRYSKIT